MFSCSEYSIIGISGLERQSCERLTKGLPDPGSKRGFVAMSKKCEGLGSSSTHHFLRQVTKTGMTGRLHQAAGMMGLLGLIAVQTSISDSRVGDNATNARSPRLSSRVAKEKEDPRNGSRQHCPPTTREPQNVFQVEFPECKYDASRGPNRT